MAQAGMPEGERREAEALEANGQLEPALRRWEAYLQTDPECPDALEAACRLAAQVGLKVRALDLLGRLARVSCREDQGWRVLYVARKLSQGPIFLDGAVPRVASVLEGSAGAGDKRPLPLWAPLSREDLPFLVGATRNRTFQAGDAIVVEAGEVFGEVALVSDAPRMATVVAATEVRALELARSEVLRVGWRHPRIIEAVEHFCRERALHYIASAGGPWADLAPQLRRAAAGAFRWRAVPAGTELIRQGSANDALYMLVRGRCLPVLTHGNGEESALPEMIEGDVFGEISLLLKKPASATVRAITPCALLVFDQDAWLNAIEAEKSVRQRFTALALQRLQASARVLAQQGGPPDGRV
jgi:CRP-like cAMP-binding protein